MQEGKASPITQKMDDHDCGKFLQNVVWFFGKIRLKQIIKNCCDSNLCRFVVDLYPVKKK